MLFNPNSLMKNLCACFSQWIWYIVNVKYLSIYINICIYLLSMKLAETEVIFILFEYLH